jgi:uncharacterized protein (TIGR02996 family)
VSTIATFLAAIAARPDDDLPRLIFADWLDEHGDTNRAEFIRLQCAAARGDYGAGGHAARLEASHRREWLADFPEVYHAEFRRGFAEHLVLSATTFIASGADLRRRTPLRSVALVGAARVLERLLNSSLLNGLSGLHLSNAFLDDEGVQRLADAPCLRELRTLRLARAGIGDAGTTAMARSRFLTRLRSLDLSRNGIGDIGAWELAESGTLRGLEHLEIGENDIGPSAAAALKSVYPGADVSGQREAARRWHAVAMK